MPKVKNEAPSPIVVVFDVNGCLASTTEDRRNKGKLTLRPGVAELARLEACGAYTCALWSSAMRHNAEKAAMALREATGLKLEHCFSREHTRAAPTKEVAHMTVKPLGARFTCVPRVILVDDVPEKAAPGEEANLVAVPPWHGAEQCQVLTTLVDRLLAAKFGEDGEDDVRCGVLAEITSELSTMGFPKPGPPATTMMRRGGEDCEDRRYDDRRDSRRDDRRDSRRDERRDNRRDERRDSRREDRRDSRRDEERRDSRRHQRQDDRVTNYREDRRVDFRRDRDHGSRSGAYADY